MRLHSRDRRPRLSASTFHLTLQAASTMRTDEGVCPYSVVLSSIENTDPNWFPLGAPPLWGGWVGFPADGVCPYRLTCSLNKETPSSLWRGRFLAMKRASLRCEETPSLFVDRSFHSPFCWERGWKWGFFWRTDEGVCSYRFPIFQIELITCLLVNSSFRQLELIIILNYELWILN